MRCLFLLHWVSVSRIILEISRFPPCSNRLWCVDAPSCVDSAAARPPAGEVAPHRAVEHPGVGAIPHHWAHTGVSAGGSALRGRGILPDETRRSITRSTFFFLCVFSDFWGLLAFNDRIDEEWQEMQGGHAKQEHGWESNQWPLWLHTQHATQTSTHDLLYLTLLMFWLWLITWFHLRPLSGIGVCGSSSTGARWGARGGAAAGERQSLLQRWLPPYW